MGVTIHYHGGLDDPTQLDLALAMLRTECDQRGWSYDEHDFEASGTFETYTFRTVPTDLPGLDDGIVETDYVALDTRWRGLMIDPHPDCEPLFMMFDPQTGRLMMLMDIANGQSLSYNLSTKTKFAPVENKIAISEFLHPFKPNSARRICTSAMKASTSTRAMLKRCWKNVASSNRP